MIRRMSSPQQVTWFLDLNHTGNLNLNPPYQRKSAWTLEIRQYFLDTIFRNYPCPAVFIHNETDDNGKTIYNVVDGKQRLKTILDFADDKIPIGDNFFDSSMAGKRFSEIQVEQKKMFWDYAIVVDTVHLTNIDIIGDIFDRLNRNTIKLNEQELRHAKYNGWFITEAENEAEDPFWKNIKISTVAKSRRMHDVQIISELMMIILERKIVGFSHNHITETYAKYNHVEELETESMIDTYQEEKERIKGFINDMINTRKEIFEWIGITANLYVLWAAIALEKMPPLEQFTNRYVDLMQKMYSIARDVSENKMTDRYSDAYVYYDSIRGANTDLKHREQRFATLKRYVKF